MSNYNWLQQNLHRFALSSQLMREVTFDIESLVYKKKPFKDKHVFVSGLARSGTTVILNAIYQSKKFASLSYSDMPFVLAPNIWSLFNVSNKDLRIQERAHKDGIKISTSSPEAFEEVFWKTFSDQNEESHEKFKIFVGKILNKYSKERYLSKNNQNIRRLSVIGKIFPNSKIIIPFRDPLQQAFSLYKQHKYFSIQAKKDHFIKNYMDLIGHTEFGVCYEMIYKENIKFQNPANLNHWLEQWKITYQNALNLSEMNMNMHLISYEDLCKDSKCLKSLFRVIDLDAGKKFQFIESKKEISDDVDKYLSKESYDLYSKLRKVSI